MPRCSMATGGPVWLQALHEDVVHLCTRMSACFDVNLSFEMRLGMLLELMQHQTGAFACSATEYQQISRTIAGQEERRAQNVSTMGNTHVQ